MKTNQAKSNDPSVVREKALRLLAVRGRARQELKIRLETSYESETVEQVLERLEAVGLLNDAAFAEDRARTLATRKGWGPAKIRSDLRQKGLASCHIERAIEDAYQEHSPRDMVNAIVEKKYGPDVLVSNLDPKLRAKIIRFLLGRGFDSHDVYSLWS